ncbi:hypothetical protein I5495_08130 [Citrobacter amalonaticus]|uniref:hypothetical protein n=1 Tax=Citrobacter amalonaticus TaxID=35703 RepID=UPI001905A7BA|nr:hypothetical protein [Citrobacter amalonaticus]MBJ9257298.1 hypothetical protein [Citrobacter amalonaticus]
MADSIEDFLNNVASQLDSKQVKVGFIDGATYPDGTPVVIAAITTELGDPANNQEPRPYFSNAISEHEKEWGDTVSRGIRGGLPVEQVLEVVGAQIQGDVQESIATLMEPALRESTIAARKSRGNNSTKPLVDTRVMIGDVSYEVGEIESS